MYLERDHSERLDANVVNTVVIDGQDARVALRPSANRSTLGLHELVVGGSDRDAGWRFHTISGQLAHTVQLANDHPSLPHATYDDLGDRHAAESIDRTAREH